ncbi:MAG: hypothetical protein KGL44_04545 [Sphingomonadales bacterium]|nr:hypothetical protein [Sphingomonadales bacterium]
MTGQAYGADYSGAVVPFTPIDEADDLLHPAEPGAPHTRIETYLLGFNIPEQAINCNIYLLWHPVLGCMSAHIFVTHGAVTYRHQLEAPYFNEHQYLPAAEGPGRFSLQLGTCKASIDVVEPLRKVAIRFADPERDFRLDVTSEAALPPVGRPGGKHFTQLMRNRGTLTLAGEGFAIDSFYMRDRSWGYERPEGAEAAPPYRWITGWNAEGDGMVIAWLDTEMLGDSFADWRAETSGERAANKWEHGGTTPGVTLRSGWISRGGQVRAVRSARIDCEGDPADPHLTRAIVLRVTDETGDIHVIRGTVRQSYPKMYWQTMLTWMHMVDLDWDGVPGHGDLMDTFSHWHFRQA